MHENIQNVVAILKDSNKELDTDPNADGTGFLSFKPELLAKAVEKLSAIHPPPATILDLGCGNGGFALLAAASGYTVCGIDIHQYIVDKCKKNIEKAKQMNLLSGIITIAQGNFYPKEEKEMFMKFRDNHKENAKNMPWNDNVQDPYTVLNILLSEIDIIYTWSWPTQSRFLFNWLERSTSEKTIFVLPAYRRYTQGEHMNASLKEPNTLILKQLADGEVFIGRKIIH